MTYLPIESLNRQEFWNVVAFGFGTIQEKAQHLEQSIGPAYYYLGMGSVGLCMGWYWAISKFKK